MAAIRSRIASVCQRSPILCEAKDLWSDGIGTKDKTLGHYRRADSSARPADYAEKIGVLLMRIEIQCPRSTKASELCHTRAILFNDSYGPVELLRNAFVGPNVNVAYQPEAVEATFGGSDEALALQPLHVLRPRAFLQ